MPYDVSNVLDMPLAYERVEKLRGMDAYERPVLLPQDMAARMVNRIITDNGKCKTRPGFGVMGGGKIDAGYTTEVQGLLFYNTGTTRKLIGVCNTNLHTSDGSTWGAAVAGWTAMGESSMVQMAQFANKVWLVDGTQRLYSYDGASTFAAINGGSDPPAGASVVVAHAGRLFVAGYDGTNAPVDQIDASSIFEADSGDWIPTSFSFRLGGDGDPIVAMVPLRNNLLAVLKENSVWLVDCNPQAASAADWNKHLLSYGVGCRGIRAAVQVANDVLFFSHDGIRSLRLMAGTEGGYEITPPLSQPLQPFIEETDWAEAGNICAHQYREYTLFSDPDAERTYVFNARLGAWMGYWDGVVIKCMVTARFSSVNRLLVGDTGARVNQWKDLDDQSLDATYQDNGTDIATTLRTRSFNFGEPISDKDGDFFEILFDDTFSVVCDIQMYYDGVAVYDDDGEHIDLDSNQNQLPVDLPFDLAVERARRVRLHLDSKGDFREAYVEITTTAGNVVFLTLSFAAFVESVRDTTVDN